MRTALFSDKEREMVISSSKRVRRVKVSGFLPTGFVKVIFRSWKTLT